VPLVHLHVMENRRTAEQLTQFADVVQDARPIKALIAAGYDYKVDAVRGIAGSRLGAGAALPPLLLDDDGL